MCLFLPPPPTYRCPTDIHVTPMINRRPMAGRAAFPMPAIRQFKTSWATSQLHAHLGPIRGSPRVNRPPAHVFAALGLLPNVSAVDQSAAHGRQDSSQLSSSLKLTSGCATSPLSVPHQLWWTIGQGDAHKTLFVVCGFLLLCRLLCHLQRGKQPYFSARTTREFVVFVIS